MDIQAIKQRFGIIGHSPLLLRALDIAVQVAPTELSVLVLGESGSGKEFFPKIIHELSARKHSNYVAINCGAIPEGTIDSELFGHEKGAFTDAREARKGYFEEANGGTVFLDEVAELPLSTQVRLLRVLETGEFLKVGSSKPQKTNVRIVAATNVNIPEAIQKGKFREDLYYRLNAITIQVPALHDRPEDIPLLFRKFSSDTSEKYRIPPLELSAEARDLLTAYRWPGNVRELKNITEQLTIIEKDRLLSAEALQRALPDEARHSLLPVLQTRPDQSGMTEREILYSVLFDMQKDIHELKRFMAQELNRKEEPHLNAAYTILPAEHSQGGLTPYPTAAEPKPGRETRTVSDVISDVDLGTLEPVEEDLSLGKREQALIEQALKKHAGNRRKAAEELGISERTIYRKIKEYSLLK
ncbi:MAG: sigma-54 dependent transcriptional regulator [Bacteroidales bacterium]|nr:sigma-54 dependent transcriptional regulator [Bacteroidales bacterium]